MSCIMPTRNRRRFVAQAIWYFLRQDYPARELVIVDDGDDRVADLVPSDVRIRYVGLESQRSIGAKRNLACELSRGELIAHWDDDDWHAADRLSTQVEALTSAGAAACGAGTLLHYAPMRGEAWLYRPAPDDPAWVAGGTLVYRKSAWVSNPFPDSSVGEDTAFVARLPRRSILTLDDDHRYLAIVHGGNTAIKHFADRRWEQRPLDDVARLIAFDRDFYVMLRNGWRHGGLAARRPASSVTVAAPFLIYDGYGAMAEYLVLGMARAGATVNVVPLSLDLSGMSAEVGQLIRSSAPEPGAPILYDGWPRPDLERFRRAGDLFFHTMWESNRLPADWPTRLNEARAVMVPTRFVADVCRDSGVTVPVEVVPEGLDPAVYRYEDRPERSGLVTLMVGPVVERKHTLEGIAAWKLAFHGDPTARLIIKARFGYGNYTPDDPRIQFVDSNETTRGIAHWYREADVLMALGNEGFGLPLIEGMATGLPVIALASEGQGDVCHAVPDLVLAIEPADWQVCDEAPFGRSGVRGVPRVPDVAAALRWVATHRSESRAMGRAASDWARANRNVWTKGPAVVDVMERHVSPPRSLRRTRTLWAPGTGAPCGIAEYTSYLASAMPPNVRVTTHAPGAATLRLLHVQHAEGLVSDSELTQVAQAARQANVPVVVTEHSVGPLVSAWEREADVLLALTSHGAETLRRRWPGKDVRHMPHGCPTWFPPRKRTTGAVIGAFGFMGRHKGFWSLLEALREIEGSSLLLFSHGRSPELDQAWTAAATGLPVRRFDKYLAVEEIARRLAAEADVLVFWYDEMPHASASGAVRIALASGVPVLTSRTGWFDGLADVTYQPDDLVAGIERLLGDTALRDRLVTNARDYCHEHSWERTAERHVALWESLEAA